MSDERIRTPSELVEAPAPTAPPKGGAARGGGKPKGPKEPVDPEAEKKHPRGRGGLWIKKGAGMEGEEDPKVRQLQNRLAALGYPVGRDGRFGPQTDAALKKFQADQKIPTSGEVDEATTAALKSATPKEGAVPDAPTAGDTKPEPELPPGAEAEPDKAAGAYGKKYEDPDAVKAQNTAVAGDSDLKRSGTQNAKGQDVNAKGELTGKDKPKKAEASSSRSTGSRDRSGSAGAGGGERSLPKAGRDTLTKGRGMGDKPDKAVKTMQTLLDAIGGNLGEAGADGRFGPDTARALRRFQRQMGLKVDGVFGKQTRAALTRRAATTAAKEAARPGASLEESTEGETQRMREKLEEAIADRKAATNGRDFSRAREREVTLRQQLQEAMPPWLKAKKDGDGGKAKGEEGAGMKRCPACKMKNAKGKAKCFKCGASLAKDGDATMTKAGDKKLEEASYRLTFLEKRSTPHVSSPSDPPYSPKEGEGKVTKTRMATDEEAKRIARGDWLRVDSTGKKPSDDGYRGHGSNHLGPKGKLREALDDGKCTCWKGYERVPGTKPCGKKSCRRKGEVEEAAVSSDALPDIPNKPGKSNWVEKAGGLPKYIRRIAKHLQAKGKDTGQSIAIAVNAAKKMCASGDTNLPGAQQVNAKARAEACAAVADWNRKRKGGALTEALALMEGWDDGILSNGLNLAELAEGAAAIVDDRLDLEEAAQRGGNRRAPIRRLPDGSFAPRGMGRVLTAGDKVKMRREVSLGGGKTLPAGKDLEVVGGTGRDTDNLKVKLPDGSTAEVPDAVLRDADAAGASDGGGPAQSKTTRAAVGRGEPSKELYRNEEGQEVWRVRDGTGKVVEDDISGDDDADFILDGEKNRAAGKRDTADGPSKARSAATEGSPADGTSGRSGTGRLRNFRSMSPAKLKATIEAVRAEGNDGEAGEALDAEQRRRLAGGDGVPAPAPGVKVGAGPTGVPRSSAASAPRRPAQAPTPRGDVTTGLTDALGGAARAGQRGGGSGAAPLASSEGMTIGAPPESVVTPGAKLKLKGSGGNYGLKDGDYEVVSGVQPTAQGPAFKAKRADGSTVTIPLSQVKRHQRVGGSPANGGSSSAAASRERGGTESGRTGRSPAGRMRNFRTMSDAKLAQTLTAVTREGNDDEAMQALRAEKAKREGSGPSGNADTEVMGRILANENARASRKAAGGSGADVTVPGSRSGTGAQAGAEAGETGRVTKASALATITRLETLDEVGGGGYFGERGSMTKKLRSDSDVAVVSAARELGLSDRQLMHWADSRSGRHFNSGEGTPESLKAKAITSMRRAAPELARELGDEDFGPLPEGLRQPAGPMRKAEDRRIAAAGPSGNADVERKISGLEAGKSVTIGSLKVSQNDGTSSLARAQGGQFTVSRGREVLGVATSKADAKKLVDDVLAGRRTKTLGGSPVRSGDAPDAPSARSASGGGGAISRGQKVTIDGKEYTVSGKHTPTRWRLRDADGKQVTMADSKLKAKVGEGSGGGAPTNAGASTPRMTDRQRDMAQQREARNRRERQAVVNGARAAANSERLRKGVQKLDRDRAAGRISTDEYKAKIRELRAGNGPALRGETPASGVEGNAMGQSAEMRDARAAVMRGSGARPSAGSGATGDTFGRNATQVDVERRERARRDERARSSAARATATSGAQTAPAGGDPKGKKVTIGGTEYTVTGKHTPTRWKVRAADGSTKTVAASKLDDLLGGGAAYGGPGVGGAPATAAERRSDAAAAASRRSYEASRGGRRGEPLGDSDRVPSAATSGPDRSTLAQMGNGDLESLLTSWRRRRDAPGASAEEKALAQRQVRAFGDELSRRTRGRGSAADRAAERRAEARA